LSIHLQPRYLLTDGKLSEMPQLKAILINLISGKTAKPINISTQYLLIGVD
jgi:hypothetical protein